MSDAANKMAPLYNRGILLKLECRRIPFQTTCNSSTRGLKKGLIFFGIVSISGISPTRITYFHLKRSSLGKFNSSMSFSAKKRDEKKGERGNKNVDTVQEATDHPAHSIYAVTAAHSESKDIKRKSTYLTKIKRMHGDWRQCDLAHAWCPEDILTDMRSSRHGSEVVRNSSLTDDSLNMARLLHMELVRIFQVRSICT